jgi:outer membrane scaffolding protein for murein synthesis (MipA/OmpV family)
LLKPCISAAAISLVAATVAYAQPSSLPGPPAGAPQGWSVSAGAGGLVSPAFRGASSYLVRPIPALIVRHGDDFALSGLEASYTPLRSGPWSAGAQARFRFGQDEKDNRVDLQGLGDVDFAAEVGGFVRYGQGPLSLKASFAHDVAGGHGGQVGTLGAIYSLPLQRTRSGPVLLSAGPSVTWASGKFNRAYYGVDAGQSARSGLARYRPGSGLESAGLSANLIAPLTSRITLVAVGGYDRLLDRAADSPRIRQRGSRDQGTIGLFLTYRIL